MLTMEKLVALSKQRGFVFPGSEIYGGLANSWDLGPLGAQLAKNIKDLWWSRFVEQRHDMVGLDGAIIMNPKIWEASGHVATFNDPLVEDKKTHERFRADHLLEEHGVDVAGMSLDAMAAMIQEKGIKSPKGNELTPPKQFNLMFQTSIGPVQDSGDAVYLRPETAQAIFVNFKNVLDTSRKRLPFGIAQIGKAFRNEITPGNFIFRVLEFDQMEIEYFVEESDWKSQFELWVKQMQEFAALLGINKSKLHEVEIEGDDLAHYSKRTIDFEFDFPFGQKELWGLAYRTDHDLKMHQEQSGKNLEYTDPDDNKRKFLPHVIEPSMGVGRTMLAVMLSAYQEEEVPSSAEATGGKGADTRVVMKFPPAIAPYQVAVLPLMKKEELAGPAKELFDTLVSQFRCEFDKTGSIGKRYRRQDEIGTPLCLTFDYDSLEDQSVTVRDRDTMKQERIKISELEAYLKGKLV